MPTGHYRFRRSLGNVGSNFRGARPDTYPLLSYVLQGRALDLSNVGSLTIRDISGNGNDATLYTGRYVALSTAEYVQFTDPTAFTTTPASVSIYARSANASGVTNVPINWGGTAVGGTIVDNGLWQQVDIDLTGILEATRLDPSVIEIGYDGSDDFIGDLAYAEIKDATDSVLDTIPLNQLDGTYTDGDPCFSTGGRIGAYKGTPIGGIEETTIPQLAGMDFNQYTVAGSQAENDWDTVSYTPTQGNVTLSATGIGDRRWACDIGAGGESGEVVTVKGTCTNVTGSPLFTLRQNSTIASNSDQGINSTGDFELTLTSTGIFNRLTISEGSADLPSAVSITNLRVIRESGNILIPESTTAGLDALGNALDFERPNNATINLNGGGYVQLPAIGDVRSVTMAIYYDGVTDTEYVYKPSNGTIIESYAGLLDTYLDSGTYYVNGVQTSVLQTGWNIIGVTFDANTSSFSNSQIKYTSGNLLAYEPDKALTAEEHLQNYNAFKSSYGL